MAHPFENIPKGKLESLNALQAQHRDDTSPLKTDLMCGVYRDNEGQPYVLPSVKIARQRLFDDPNWNHEYPSSHLGEKQFRDLSASLFFGENSVFTSEGRVASMQCLGASGACHMGAVFLKKHYEPYQKGKTGKVYIPAETWANHPNVFQSLGFETEPLPWYSPGTHLLNMESLMSVIKGLPPQSIILLQTVGNNPTGCDPSVADWHQLAEAFVAGKHFAFLDAAYPGFATGNFEMDCAPIRIFSDAGIPLLLAATFGKSFGLYGERVGLLSIPVPSRDIAGRVEDQMKLLARAETGAQPAFGAALVQTILADAELRRVWQVDLKHMAEQLDKRRRRLLEELEKLQTSGDWHFITRQRGMFCFTGLSIERINRLRGEHHVYLQDTGRLSIAGLNSSNIRHVAGAIDVVMRT